jgi:dienelactone hydrolase
LGSTGRRTAAFLVIVGLVVPAIGRAADAPRLDVSPPSAMVDEPIAVRATGLRAGTEATLRVRATDASGREWRSEAVFRADGKGTVDLSRDAPVGGTYTGVERMGLFWAMDRQPAAGGAPTAPAEPPGGLQALMLPPTRPPFARPPAGGIATTVELLVDGAVANTVTLERRLTSPSTTVSEVHEQGLVGRLYAPGGRRPAVMVLGGSNGGISPAYAPTLAAHGFTTFSLAYFQAPGLPADLVEIPLEYFGRALDWLQHRPEVDPERVAVLGISRGGELSLLLGTQFDVVRAVVAFSPSSVVWEGAIRDPARRGLAAVRADRSAWSRNGQALPYARKQITPELERKITAGERFAVIEYHSAEAVSAAPAEAVIPIERSRAPILLVSGRGDRMWPSEKMAEQVVERRRAAKGAAPIDHRTYDDASHVLHDAWLPPQYGGTMGGTAAGTIHAFEDYWPRVIEFLGGALGAIPAADSAAGSRPSGGPSRERPAASIRPGRATSSPGAPPRP